MCCSAKCVKLKIIDRQKRGKPFLTEAFSTFINSRRYKLGIHLALFVFKKFVQFTKVQRWNW